MATRSIVWSVSTLVLVEEAGMQPRFLGVGVGALCAALALSAVRSEPEPGQSAPGSDEVGNFHYDRAAVIESTLVAGSKVDSPNIVAWRDQWWVAWLEYDPAFGDRIRVGVWDGAGEPNGKLVEGLGDHLAAPTLSVDGRDRLWLTFEQAVGNAGDWNVHAMPYAAGEGAKPLRVSPAGGSDIRHRVAATEDGLYVVWQGDVGGQFEVLGCAVTPTGSGDVFPVSTSARGDWHPDVAVTADGDLWVVWDCADAGVFQVLGRRRHGESWSAVATLASGPRFQGRARVASGRDGGPWVLWEEGAENWGKLYRGNDKLWNNVTDAYGPVHRRRRLEVGRLVAGQTAEGQPSLAVEILESGLPQPAFAVAEEESGRRPGVRDLGVFYERGVLSVDGRGRPWITYRHYHERQLGLDEPVIHHVEEGWRIYTRCLRDSGWSPARRLDQPQRDGLQRLSVAARKDGIALAWAIGRTDRHTDPLPLGLAFAQVQEDTGTAPDPARRHQNLAPVVAAPPVPDRPRSGAFQLFFGDLHRHTDLSLCFPFYDGSLDDAYRYAIEVANLDFLGITDHTRDIDRGNVQSLLWWRCTKEVQRHRLGTRFFPFFAYERSHGDTDHNVISLRSDRLRSFPPPLPEFWAELGGDTLTIPHNPFLGKVWDYQDDDLRPLLEIYQGFRDDPAHGPAHAQEGLERGYHLGFIASSDHLSTSASYAGVWSPEPSREAVFRSLQARRTFAATTPLQLELRAGEHWMGERIRGSAPLTFAARVQGTGPVRALSFLLDGVVQETVTAAGGTSLDAHWQPGDLPPVEHYVYVHVLQENGEQAWSSPLWFGDPASGEE